MDDRELLRKNYEDACNASYISGCPAIDGVVFIVSVLLAKCS